MPKICFIHGVGNHKPGFSKPLSDRVAKQTGAEIIEYIWGPDSPVPDPSEINAMQHFRGISAEIMLYFLRSVLDYTRYNSSLPEADMYVGHSAGSVIIAGTSKPKVFMASPLRLVYDESISGFAGFEGMTAVRAVKEAVWDYPALNIICKEDVVAFKFPHEKVINKMFSVPSWNLLARCVPSSHIQPTGTASSALTKYQPGINSRLQPDHTGAASSADQ